MKKLGLLLKEEAKKIIKDNLQKADSIFLVKYSGLSAVDLNILRNSLCNCGSTLMVTKNSVVKRVFQDQQDYQALCSFIQGPCGLVFVNKDLIITSHIIRDFAKNHPNFDVKAGLLKDRILTRDDIELLSKIPSLSSLHGKLVGGLKSPIHRLAFSLKQILNKLVWVLDKIKEKK